MADARARHPRNAPGAWFVDTTCIDCDACRQLAPAVFTPAGGQSVVRAQPSADDEDAAVRALLACPTGSIGALGRPVSPVGVFPHPIDDGVFYCGFNAESSFGANAFFARRPWGNVMVDAPRFATPLVRALEGLGGIGHVLLTHRDDVADAERFARHFGARVWIHADDADAAPFATDVLRGRSPSTIAPGLLAIPVPGHTRGSVAYLLDSQHLFSGDSLHWSRARQDLSAFADACWYSWEEQADSLERLADHPFEWVLAGHGDRDRRPAPEMRARLLALVARMRGPDGGKEGDW
jgi:glyoxylase-like metal-dependent hydrolase (beta-lactamase superfamily II)/ferredoxin